MRNLVEHLNNIKAVGSDAELWQLHTEHMARYGFVRLLYGFTGNRKDNHIGSADDWSVLTNHPPGYMKAFMDAGLIRHAPMVKWAVENSGSQSWRMVADLADRDALTEGEKEVLALNAKWDVLAGYTISFRSVSERTKAAIGVAALPDMSQDDVDAFWEEHGPYLAIAKQMFHLKRLTLPFSGSPKLTQLQIGVLEWVGDGKTVQDIALIMHLKPATVDKHLRLAREALEVEITAQAVLKANFFSQMHLIDGEDKP